MACLFIRSRTDKSKGRSRPSCLSVLSKKITAWPWQLAQDRLLACLSCLESFARGLRRRRAKKKRPLSRAFLLATDCGELLGDYLHVASMPRMAIIIATTIANSIIVDSPIGLWLLQLSSQVLHHDYI